MRTPVRRGRAALIALAAAAGLTIGAAAFVDANGATTGFATTAATYDLYAGQDQLAGQVFVWDVDGDAYVQYVANHGWCMTETHVEVAATEAGIPQTSKGNPIPGQFSQGETFDGCVGLAGHYVFADAFDGGHDVVVAAHAAMRYTMVEGPSWATMVVDSNQALLKNTNPVATERSIPTNALVADYVSGGATSFFSLGFGGDLTVGFDCGVVNGEGDDLRIYEATNGSYPIESAEVYASMDGADWTLLGYANNTTADPTAPNGERRISSFDLGDLPYATYVWIVDVSIPDPFEATADAFDVDGVQALQDCGVGETAWADGTRFVERGNWATYAAYAEGDGTLVNTTGEELTFLVFDLGDPAADLGGMAWMDGPQHYAAHTVCTEVEGDRAWFTYRIPDTAVSAPGYYVTFDVTAGSSGPIGYTYSPSMGAMVDLCVNHTPISGGYDGTPNTGTVVVHPGLD